MFAPFSPGTYKPFLLELACRENAGLFLKPTARILVAWC